MVSYTSKFFDSIVSAFLFACGRHHESNVALFQPEHSLSCYKESCSPYQSIQSWNEAHLLSVIEKYGIELNVTRVYGDCFLNGITNYAF